MAASHLSKRSNAPPSSATTERTLKSTPREAPKFILQLLELTFSFVNLMEFLAGAQQLQLQGDHHSKVRSEDLLLG
jgi:hypothetical protein